MRFYIIDDREPDHTYVTMAVRSAFPDGSFALPPGTTFSSWTTAAQFLRGEAVAIGAEETVFMLDMSLGDGDAEAQISEGIKRAAALRDEFPKAIVIACTQYDRVVNSREQAANIFHGVFAKEIWRAYASTDEKLTYVRTVIEGARPHDSSIIDEMRERANVDDSLGIRSFQAAFGEEALGELIFTFADPADIVSVRALTGGLSGAFLFEIKTTGPRGRRARIVKIARDRNLIESEVAGLATHSASLGPLAGAILAPSSKVIRTMRCGAHYLEQVSVDGEDLLRLTRRDPVTGAPAVRSYISLLAKSVSYAVGVSTEVRCQRLGDLFKFTPLDFERLRVSAQFLEQIGPRLDDAGLWPAQRSPAESAVLLCDVGSAWRQNRLDFLEVLTPVHVQHGDAHLANVLLPVTGHQLLVDIARVGVWPTGYDMSRAAIQMRLRLLDHRGAADYMPERLPRWFDNASNGSSEELVLADECEAAFQAAVEASEYAGVLATAFRAGTVWDLLKISSYGDISPFKRVWAMLYALQLVDLLLDTGSSSSVDIATSLEGT